MVQKKDISEVLRQQDAPINTARQHVSKQRAMYKENLTYYSGLPRQFEDEEAMHKGDTPTDNEEL